MGAELADGTRLSLPLYAFATSYPTSAVTSKLLGLWPEASN